MHDFAKLSVFQDAAVGAPASFARATYHAIHTFIVTSDDGTRRWVRFSWQPLLGVLTNDPTMTPENIYLRKELDNRISRGPPRFSLMLSIGEGGDEFNNSSRAWSFQRRRIFMGTMTIDKLADDQCIDNEYLSFNPCRVVEGIDLSDDPILRARKEIYEVSRLRRGAPRCPFSRS
jgi:catalase